MTGPSVDRLTGAALAQALLRPRSIALVGGAGEAGQNAERMLRRLEAARFEGPVHLVDPETPAASGQRRWPALAALPQAPELVFVLAPPGQVLRHLVEAAAVGARLAVVHAARLVDAEAQQVRDLCARTGLRVLGPDSGGVVHAASRLVLSPNPVFEQYGLDGGTVFVASQSGAVGGALVTRARERGVGFAGFVAVGAEADLSLGEVCAATLDDLRIEGYLLVLDELRQGEALRGFCREALLRGKPVLAYQLPRAAGPARKPAFQTLALAEGEDLAQVFLRDLGVGRVHLLESLFEAFPLAQRLPAQEAGAGARRVGVLGTSASAAPRVLEQLVARGVVVDPPATETLEKLLVAGIDAAAGPVLELKPEARPQAAARTVGRALDLMLGAPEFDLVLAVLGASPLAPAQQAVQPALEHASAPRPLAVLPVPEAPAALALLSRAGVPCFRSAEACADALAAVLGRQLPVAEAARGHPRTAGARRLHDAQAYRLLDALDVPRVPAVTVPMATGAVKLPFAWPVAVKACSPQLPRRSDVGGVVLDVKDAAQFAAACETVRRNLAQHAPGIACEQLLVQPMRRGLAEVLVSYFVDDEAGPLVMVAAGGVWAEVARDLSLRLAPVDVAGAHAMISEVHALRSLRGLGERPAGDVEALARAIAALSRLALQPQLRIVLAELNPVVVLRPGEGVQAVDALVLQAPEATRAA